jgi:ABC-type multidrug transport system fused ATPase/permease subunit
MVSQGRLNPVFILPIIALTITAFGPVLAAASVIQDLNQALAGAERLFCMMDRIPAVQDMVTTPPMEPVEPSIRFEGVRFRYRGETSWVLKDLDFEVPVERMVALVGPNGAGKSTVVNLLLRFWDADEGNIRLGRYSVRDFPQEDLRQRIAVVSQRTYLFNTTIKENLRGNG